MTTPRVYVVQRPTARADDGHSSRPTMDLSPASAFGELVFMLPSSHNPFADLADTADLIQEQLEDYKADHRDYLLLVGNPILIGLAATLFARQTGGLRCLQWQSRAQRYDEAYVKLDVQRPLLAGSPAPV